MRFGEWEGLTWDEVSARDAAYARALDGGISLASHTRRRGVWQLPEAGTGSAGSGGGRIPGGCAAVVTHGGVIRTFLLDVLNLPESALGVLSCEYASCIEVQLRAGQWYAPVQAGLQDMQTRSWTKDVFD